MNKNALILDDYEQWGEGTEGLTMAISNVRMDEINATGRLDRLLKSAEVYAEKGDIEAVKDFLYTAHDEAMFSADQEWIDALLNLIFHIEQYT